MAVQLSNSVYDWLKKATQVGLPAAGSLYFGLSQIWGLPAGEEVVGSLALLTTFFGVVLGVSTKNYNESDASVDGDVIIETDTTGKKTFGFALNEGPENLQHKQRITFRVIDENEEFYSKNPRPPAE